MDGFVPIVASRTRYEFAGAWALNESLPVCDGDRLEIAATRSLALGQTRSPARRRSASPAAAGCRRAGTPSLKTRCRPLATAEAIRPPLVFAFVKHVLGVRPLPIQFHDLPGIDLPGRQARHIRLELVPGLIPENPGGLLAHLAQATPSHHHPPGATPIGQPQTQFGHLQHPPAAPATRSAPWPSITLAINRRTVSSPNTPSRPKSSSSAGPSRRRCAWAKRRRRIGRSAPSW